MMYIKHFLEKLVYIQCFVRQANRLSLSVILMGCQNMENRVKLLIQIFQVFLLHLKKLFKPLISIRKVSQEPEKLKFQEPLEYLIFNIERELFWAIEPGEYTDLIEKALHYPYDVAKQIVEQANKEVKKEIIILANDWKDPMEQAQYQLRVMKIGHMPRSCIGCGYCCRQALCDFAKYQHPTAEYCPELKWNGERHLCQLMLLPGEEGQSYRDLLRAEMGCLSPYNPWWIEPLRDRTEENN